MRDRPRIALLTTLSPCPRDGASVRLAALYQAARQVGTVDVHLWGMGRARQRTADLVHHPLRWPPALLGTIGNLLERRPLSLGPYRLGSPYLPEGYDLVLAFQLKTWRWAARSAAGVRVLELTDALSAYRRLPEVPWTKRALLYGVAEEEAEAAAAFAEVWVASPRDGAVLQARGIPSRVIPNAPLHWRPLPPGRARNLLFVANLTYPPNRKGLEHFLRDIWPDLWPLGFRLTLVGRGTEAYRHVPGVTAHGFQEDLLPFYEASALAISPVFFGTGSQSKIWEALGFGRVVVADGRGLEETLGAIPRVLPVPEPTPRAWRAALLAAERRALEPASPLLPLPERFQQAIEALLARRPAHGAWRVDGHATWPPG